MINHSIDLDKIEDRLWGNGRCLVLMKVKLYSRIVRYINDGIGFRLDRFDSTSSLL